MSGLKYVCNEKDNSLLTKRQHGFLEGHFDEQDVAKQLIVNMFLSDPYMHAVGFSHLHDVDYYPPVKAHPLEKKWAYSYLLGGKRCNS